MNDQPLPEAAYDHLSPDELRDLREARARSPRRAFRARKTRRPEDPHTAGLRLDSEGYEW